MTVVGWNAAMHAASILGQPGKALEFLEEAKVSSAAARHTCVLSTLQREREERESGRKRAYATVAQIFECLFYSRVAPRTRNVPIIPHVPSPPRCKQAKGIKLTEVTYATAIGACAKATTDKKANGRKVRYAVQ